MRIFLEQTDEEHPMSWRADRLSQIVWGSVQSVRLSMMILKPCGILEWISWTGRSTRPVLSCQSGIWASGAETSGGCSTVLQMYHQWEIPTADQEAGEPCQCLWVQTAAATGICREPYPDYKQECVLQYWYDPACINWGQADFFSILLNGLWRRSCVRRMGRTIFGQSLGTCMAEWGILSDHLRREVWKG